MSSRATKTARRKRAVWLPRVYDPGHRLSIKEQERIELAVKSYILGCPAMIQWVHYMAFDHFDGLVRFGRQFDEKLGTNRLDIALDLARNTITGRSPRDQWDHLIRLLSMRLGVDLKETEPA